jgi:phage gp45-like
MHRATPLSTSFRAYSSGGAKGVVDKVDDTKLMQEMGGNFMHNETRDSVESPQNYGFTSVVFDSEKDQMGNIQSSAEHFTSFLGGNRSIPMAIMDDRRHRLYKLEKGDTAMFRGRGDYQQFHMTQDGGFWSAPQDKTVRMSLLQKDSQSNATMNSGSGGSSGGGAPTAQAADSTGGSSSSSQAQGQQQRGQEAVYKDAQKSPLFVDITKDASRVAGKEVHLMLDDGNVYAHIVGGEVYLGGKKGSGTFGHVSTDAGVSTNVYAKVG